MDEQRHAEVTSEALEAAELEDEPALGDAAKGTDDGFIGQNIDF